MALRGRTEPHRPPGGAKGIRCPHRIPQRQNSAPSGPPRCPPPHSPTPRGALNAPLRPLLPKPPPTPTPPQSPPNPPGFQLLPRGLHHRRLLSGLLLRRRPPLHGITFGFIWAFLTHRWGVLLWTGGGGSNAGVGLSVPAQSGAQTAPPTPSLPPLSLRGPSDEAPIHADRLPHQLLPVQPLHGRLRLFVRLVLHQRVSLWGDAEQ